MSHVLSMDSIDRVVLNDDPDPRKSSTNMLLTEHVDGLTPGLDCIGERESFLNGYGSVWAWLSIVRDLRPLVMVR